MNLLFFLLAVGGLGLLDGRRVRKQGNRRDFQVYVALMGLAAVVGTLLLLGVRLPSPLEPINHVFTPLGRLMTGG